MSLPHTRATNQNLFECDAELERTIRRNIQKTIVDTIVDNIPDEEIPVDNSEEEEISERRMAAHYERGTRAGSHGNTFGGENS